MSSGNFNDDLNFEYGNGATVYQGCGAMFMDQFWYFGGVESNNIRQVNIFKIFDNEKRGGESCERELGMRSGVEFDRLIKKLSRSRAKVSLTNFSR